MKNPKLTTEEEQELHAFIGKCVLSDAHFQSYQMGVHNLTIQQLISDYSTDSKIQYGKRLEKELASSTASVFDSEDTKLYVSGKIEATDLIHAILLMVKRDRYLKELAKLRQDAKAVKKQLDAYKTPDEHKAELEAQLANLEAELV